MLYESYIENMLIYMENVSYFYVFCAMVSFLAVGFTWWIQPQCSCINVTQENKIEESNITATASSTNSVSFRSNVKVDKKSLIESLEQSLTKDDKLKECEVEKQQLKEIFELMKKDEKFNISSVEELEEQLRLYRK